MSFIFAVIGWLSFVVLSLFVVAAGYVTTALNSNDKGGIVMFLAGIAAFITLLFNYPQ